MVMFVMTIAVMSIMMGVAVQTAEFQMKREREAELIFRGQQFIEAIRLYKLKYGRYPMQLKEIYEAKPRVIRKKWKDPITDSENWGIVFLGQEGRQLGGRRAPGSITDAGGRAITTQTPFGSGSSSMDDSWGESGSGATGDDSDPSAFGGGSANRKVGPIVGVHSTSCDEAVKIYEGHTTYCEWRFIYREQQQPGRGGGRGGTGGTGRGGVHAGDWLNQTPGPGGSEQGGTGRNPPGPIQTPRP
jgi:type II secretory pathway pseudopilin PulG